MSELYNRIDQLCKARGTNVTALCKKAGVGRATLSELNAGRTKTLKLETAQKLADALGVSLNLLQGKYDDDGPISFTVSASELQDHLSEKKAPTPEDGRDFAQNDHEEDMLLLARHMAQIPEEDRKALKEQFRNSIDLYLKAKGISDLEVK